MPFKHKLAKRLALMRASGVGLAVAAFACTADRSISGPPSFDSQASSQSGQVLDLKVTTVNQTSVSLSFTEVDDGTGQPASYDVRYAVGALSWGSAPSVTSGSCALAVAGSLMGAQRSCTVQGLTPATGYQFQLIPFRGTLNMGTAVFGSVSNVASGTTAALGQLGTVLNLAVASATDSSLTLSFTEVDDGTGQPASYDVRYAVGALSWGSAPSVTNETCTTPLAGSAIGNKRSCTVLGLTPATGYQFQLIPLRGRLNMGTAFFFNDSAATEIYTLSLHDALPILNLAVASATDSSLTLSFTEVDDGTGQPA